MRKLKTLIFFMILIFTVAVNQSFSKLIDISLKISPNNDGMLEGYAGIDLNWSKYFYNGFSYQTESYSLSDKTGTSGEAFNVSRKEYNIYLTSTLSEAFKKINMDWFDVQIGLLGRFAEIEEMDYGVQDRTTNFYFYTDMKTINYFKPLLTFNGIISANDNFWLTVGGEWSILSNKESTVGAYSDSLTNALIEYVNDDWGFELRLVGSLGFQIKSILGVYFQYQWFRHIAWSQGYSGNGLVNYVYESIDQSYSVSFDLLFLKEKLEWIEYSPTIGATYTDYRMNIDEIYNVPSESDIRLKFDFGIQL